MKQALAIIVILLAIVTVIFLVVLSNQATSENQTTKQTETSLIKGTVTSLTPNTITISNGNTQKVITINDKTTIVDSSGNEYSFDQIQKNFTIQIEGNDAEKQKITILSQPNVIVYTPEASSIVGQRFMITGVARVFENVVSIKITDFSSKEVLLETYATADAPDIGKYGGFTKEIDLQSLKTIKNGAKIVLTVYQASPKDGSEQDSVTLPLTLDVKKNLTVKAYFTNETLNPTTICELVFPVEREIPYTKATARAALEELVKGPSDQDALKGYGTSLNTNIKVNNIAIEDGVARVDFSSELNKNVAGSCRVQSIRAQIEETLKQFPSVQSVKISVEGNEDTILQP